MDSIHTKGAKTTTKKTPVLWCRPYYKISIIQVGKLRPREGNRVKPKLVSYKTGLTPSQSCLTLEHKLFAPYSSLRNGRQSTILAVCDLKWVSFSPGTVSSAKQMRGWSEYISGRCDGWKWKRRHRRGSPQGAWWRVEFPFFNSYLPSTMKHLLILILCQALCWVALWLGIQRRLGHSPCH